MSTWSICLSASLPTEFVYLTTLTVQGVHTPQPLVQESTRNFQWLSHQLLLTSESSQCHCDQIDKPNVEVCYHHCSVHWSYDHPHSPISSPQSHHLYHRPCVVVYGLYLYYKTQRSAGQWNLNNQQYWHQDHWPHSTSTLIMTCCNRHMLLSVVWNPIYCSQVS